MKKLISYLLVVMLIPTMVLTGCKDDPAPAPATGDFATLSTYMINNGLDLPALLVGWVIAPKLTTETDGIVTPNTNTIPTYNVFDIRSQELFDAGHIPGAIHVDLANVVTEAANYTNKPILVVCKTGQTAGRAVMALRLSGYADAKVMKFGMSYWNEEFDLWTGNIGDNADGSPNWVTNASGDLPVNGFPTWTTTSTDGAEILATKVDEMLNASGWGIASDEVLADPVAFNTYNFWTEADYTTIGHFAGAYQYKPISLAGDIVAALPQTDDCLVYCFTGQTSSFIVAWLQVLGYTNAKSILFGVNKLKHSTLDAADKPAWHHSFDYVFETK